MADDRAAAMSLDSEHELRMEGRRWSRDRSPMYESLMLSFEVAAANGQTAG
jgi:hypothetical protein